jgi:hypothetical protein
MITLSDSVLDDLRTFRGRNAARTIRIEKGSSGWHSTNFELALDEPEEGDVTEDVGEFHFCMEKALMDQVGAVFIDYDPTGSFRIYTERPLSIFTTGGGSCSL